MRVLLWSSAFWPSIGGIQVLAAKLLPALESSGHHHLVVATKKGCKSHETASFDGIPVHYFPFWQSMADAEQLAHVRRELSEVKREFAPDLVHINGLSRSNFFHHLTAHVHSCPVLVSLHSGWHPAANQIAARTLHDATWVVGCSRATVSMARQTVPEIRSRSSVIYNGLEEPTVRPARLMLDPPRILCMGRLVEDKGIDLAIDAVSRLTDRFDGLRLVVAGDGPARVDLEGRAAKLGIAHAVEFTGWVEPDEIPGLINKASLIVVPSRWQEPFGLVALRASLMARPVVATRVGGLPEVVEHRQTGLLAEPEDAQALAQAIAAVLQSPADAERMGRQGRVRALEQFGWERYVAAYRDMYDKVATAC